MVEKKPAMVETGALSGVAGRHDRRRLDHKDDSLLWGARSMDYTFWDYEALLW